jgi:hypothetical protein
MRGIANALEAERNEQLRTPTGATRIATLVVDDRTFFNSVACSQWSWH